MHEDVIIVQGTTQKQVFLDNFQFCQYAIFNESGLYILQIGRLLSSRTGTNPSTTFTQCHHKRTPCIGANPWSKPEVKWLCSRAQQQISAALKKKYIYNLLRDQLLCFHSKTCMLMLNQFIMF